jgi:hypothetical protein
MKELERIAIVQKKRTADVDVSETAEFGLMMMMIVK